MKNTLYSDEEKLSEKAFIQGIVTCVISIVLCMIALCSVTWAWFRTDISSVSNTIETGTYTLNIDIENAEKKASTDTSYTYYLNPNVRYQIKLSVQPSSIGNGYCKIKIGEDKYYYTDNISTQFSEENPFLFDLMIQTEDEIQLNPSGIPVTFELHWGIYSGDPDVHLEENTLIIDYDKSQS